MSITGKYCVTLSLPGGNRNCILDLTENSGIINGAISNPYIPDELLPIFDGTSADGKISFKAMVGRTAYIFSGSLPVLTLTTNETIVLDPGKRLNGVTGEVAGEYLVGVYSPGGVKENHMVINADGDELSGEMFGLVTEESMAQMAQMMGRMGLPNGAAPSGKPDGFPGPDSPPEPQTGFGQFCEAKCGPSSMPASPNPDGGSFASPVPPMPPMKIGDKTDVNVFSSGKKNGNSFELQTVTAQGSLFRFAGSVNGDIINITMHVTDVTEGLEAVKI